jgi:hypothetical protein
MPQGMEVLLVFGKLGQLAVVLQANTRVILTFYIREFINSYRYSIGERGEGKD